MNVNERREADEADRNRLAGLLADENTREPTDPSPGEQRHLAMFLPCENPINPHMESLHNRIETFSRWPQNHTRATVQEIAKAGFFYLGESDKTKCYYCNGGLQNWDFNDEPWSEHAKWFPGCEFILRNKGVTLVRRLVDAHPNLNRPTIRNPIDLFSIPSYEESAQVPVGTGEARCQDSVARNAEIVTGAVNQPAPVLVKEKRQGERDQEIEPKRQKIDNPGSTGSTLLNNLREIEESLLCRICRTKKAEAVVMPCAHLCACHDCAPKIKRCPTCDHRVREFMNVFRA